MRKGIIAITVLSLSIIMSCKKDNYDTPGGFWSYNSNTYHAESCVADSTHYTLTSYNTVTGGTYSNIIVYFYSALPDTGSYTIEQTNNLTAQNQAAITLTYQTATLNTIYTSVVKVVEDQPVYQKIKVTRVNGELNISGSAIRVATTTIAADTIPLTFNITQTQ